MKTRITELFNIRHPIIQGGMHYVGLAPLASAVSNAGGLGMVTALTLGTPEKLAQEIAKMHELTDQPFGVNLTFLPSFSQPPYEEYIAAIREGGVKVVRQELGQDAQIGVTCHNSRRLLLSRRSDWTPSLTRMHDYRNLRGVQALSPEETQRLVRYFNTYYGLIQ